MAPKRKRKSGLDSQEEREEPAPKKAFRGERSQGSEELLWGEGFEERGEGSEELLVPSPSSSSAGGTDQRESASPPDQSFQVAF